MTAIQPSLGGVILLSNRSLAHRACFADWFVAGRCFYPVTCILRHWNQFHSTISFLLDLSLQSLVVLRVLPRVSTDCLYVYEEMWHWTRKVLLRQNRSFTKTVLKTKREFHESEISLYIDITKTAEQYEFTKLNNVNTV